MSSTPVGVEILGLELEDSKTADSEADFTGVENSLDLLLLNKLLEEELRLGDISKLFNETELFNTWVKFLSCKLNIHLVDKANIIYLLNVTLKIKIYYLP